MQRVKDATDGRGADVILDIIGASYLDRNIDALAADGRIACIGMQSGARAELDMSKLMVKRATLSCTTLRARPAEQKAAIVAAVREDVWPLVEAGSIRPVVYRELPFAAGRRGAPHHGGEHSHRQAHPARRVAAGTR